MYKRKVTKPFVITFRATPGEKQAVLIMAKREGIPMTELVRMLIREGADKRGLNVLGLLDLPTLRKEGTQ